MLGWLDEAIAKMDEGQNYLLKDTFFFLSYHLADGAAVLGRTHPPIEYQVFQQPGCHPLLDAYPGITSVTVLRFNPVEGAPPIAITCGAQALRDGSEESPTPLVLEAPAPELRDRVRSILTSWRRVVEGLDVNAVVVRPAGAVVNQGDESSQAAWRPFSPQRQVLDARRNSVAAGEPYEEHDFDSVYDPQELAKAEQAIDEYEQRHRLAAILDVSTGVAPPVAATEERPFGEAAEEPSGAKEAAPAWTPPAGSVGAKTVCQDARFRKQGKNPSRSTIQRWERKARGGRVGSDPRSGEIYYAEKWVEDRWGEWNPRA
jgi:hypothetical protein